MGDDSAPKNTGIPAWQRPGQSDASTSAPFSPASTSPADKASQHPTDNEQSTHLEAESNAATASSPEARIDQAIRFLTDDSLQDAPLEQKTAFLESKGLSKPEIDQAIKESTKPSSRTSSQTTSLQPLQPNPSQSQPPPLPSRDVPPIITYPEFLVHSQKPPPIITAHRLLNTAYIAAGIGAAIYGASKYLVTPMTEALTDARHDFASHVKEQVEQLNAKLSSVVSADTQDPASSPSARKTLRFKDEDTASEDSSNSDPTELFHRDFGTQTSPAQSTTHPPPRSPSSSSDSDNPLDAAKDPTSALSALSNSITALTNNDAVAASSAAEISTVITVLNEYLESLAYPSFTSNNTYGAPYMSADKAKPDDEVGRFKAEIRGVKGVLLSARNFPGSGGGRRAFYSPAAAGTA